MKSFQTRIFAIFGLLLFIAPMTFTPLMVIAMDSNQTSHDLFQNASAYRKITDLEGALTAGPDEVQYLVYMEEGKEYIFTVQFNLDITGLFNLQINRPGEDYGFEMDYGVWSSGDASVEKILNFTAIADTTGEHTLLVENGGTGSAATYVLNFGPTVEEGLDWWWYVAIGGGGLVALIIIIVIISLLVKGKKKKPKKKSKKKK